MLPCPASVPVAAPSANNPIQHMRPPRAVRLNWRRCTSSKETATLILPLPLHLATATARPAKLMLLRVKQDNYYVDLVPLRPSPLTRRNLCRSCASSKEIATPILFCTIRRPICLRAATARPAKIDVVAYQARRLPRRPCSAPSAKANLPAATTTRSAKIDVVAYYQARRLPRRPSRTALQTCPSPPLARL